MCRKKTNKIPGGKKEEEEEAQGKHGEQGVTGTHSQSLQSETEHGTCSNKNV